MDLTCSPNTLTAFDYFLRKGLKDFQAAGIVGNLMWESNVNPTQYQLNGGPGRGIAQWTESQRWQNVLAYARQTERSEWSLDLQLDYLWYELQSVYPWSLALPAVQSATTLESATVAFQDNFEKCGDCHTDKRIEFARTALLGCPSLVPPVIRRHPAAAATIFTLSALALVAGAAYAAGWELKRERQ